MNGKGLDKDPIASDTDEDGVPDYYDFDSDWDVNPKKLKKERERYHQKRNRSNAERYGK